MESFGKGDLVRFIVGQPSAWRRTTGGPHPPGHRRVHCPAHPLTPAGRLNPPKMRTSPPTPS